MKTRKDIRFLFPKLQRRYMALLALCAVLSTILGGSLTALALMKIAGTLPNDGGLLLRGLPTVIGTQLVVGLAITVPIFALVGVLASMPLFGAVFRIQQYLQDVEEGREGADLVLRADDPLQDLAALSTRITVDQRKRNRENGQRKAA